MGWTRRANPKWSRKASRQSYPSEVRTTLNYDRHGTTKKNGWCSDWTGSRNRSRRYVNSLHRHAAKLMIAHELYQDAEWQDELYEQQVGYDDDFDLPDWWYGPEDDYEYPEPEPEDDDWYNDPYWYDDYYGED